MLFSASRLEENSSSFTATKELLGTVGLTFDVIGCLFLFHTLTDLLLIASNGWGGLSPSLQKKRFKNFKIKVIGTLFLVLGFALQGAAQLQN
jgi:hypothetical protein